MVNAPSIPAPSTSRVSRAQERASRDTACPKGPSSGTSTSTWRTFRAPMRTTTKDSCSTASSGATRAHRSSPPAGTTTTSARTSGRQVRPPPSHPTPDSRTGRCAFRVPQASMIWPQTPSDTARRSRAPATASPVTTRGAAPCTSNRSERARYTSTRPFSPPARSALAYPSICARVGSRHLEASARTP